MNSVCSASVSVSFRASLVAGLLLGVCATVAVGQRRPIPPAPSSRAISLLTATDSITLVEASARVVLSVPGAATCVVSVDDSIGGAVGAAFRQMGRQVAGALPAAGARTGNLGVRLLGVRDGDTATVLLRLSGTVAPPSRAFWSNDIDYYFVRTDEAQRWQFVARRLTAASDFVAAGGRARKPRCLNGRSE